MKLAPALLAISLNALPLAYAHADCPPDQLFSCHPMEGTTQPAVDLYWQEVHRQDAQVDSALRREQRLNDELDDEGLAHSHSYATGPYRRY